MLRIVRQLAVPVSWFATAVVLSGFAIAQVPATSPAVSADIFSSVHEGLSEAADRALAASLPDQSWMSAASNPAKRPETLGDGQESPVRKLRLAIKRVNELRRVLEPILRDEGVPVELSAVVLVESGGVITALSPKGARGVWQFMPDTARRYGLAVDARHDDRTDVVKSTRAAGHYLRDLFATFGDWSLALAAYNAGKLTVTNAMNRAKSRDFRAISGGALLPSETRSYVPAVFAAMNRLQYVGGYLDGGQSRRTRVIYAFSGPESDTQEGGSTSRLSFVLPPSDLAAVERARATTSTPRQHNAEISRTAMSPQNEGGDQRPKCRTGLIESFSETKHPALPDS